MNCVENDNSNELILLARKLAHDVGISDNCGDAARILSERLVASSSNILKVLPNNRESTIATIQILSQDAKREALFSFLANLEIPRDDTTLLEAAVNVGLNGDAWGRHRWIIDYDIVTQRLKTIRSIILPYVEAISPQKKLFLALKAYEYETLAVSRPLLDPAAIHRVIGASRGGIPVIPPAEHFDDQSDRANSVRLVLPNETFSTLLRLAWVAPDYVFDLQERHSPEDLVSILRTHDKVIPVCLIPTHLGYPMGGGESFMHQTCRILSEFGIRCVWVSFRDPKTGWYTQDSLTYTPYFTDVRFAGGCSKEAILRAVDQFNPDLIHTQGDTNDVVIEIAEQTRLTALVGYHFWGGLIELGQTGNRHIIENLARHKLSPKSVTKSRAVRKYVASEFMLDIYTRLGGQEDLRVIHPISDTAHFLANRDDCGSFVVQVNVCSLKGGNIFLDCVKALGDDIPFMGIVSEPEDSDFISQLSDEIARHPRCVLNSYGNVREFYRAARLVIVPTLVDETFCRVAFEAAMNGIPVLSTGNGYLPFLLGETGIFLPEANSRAWIDTVRDLYCDVDRLKQIGQAQRARLQAMYGSDTHSFTQTAMQLIDNSTTRNIGIFTVWGDQGMGNHTHAYAQLLRSVGYKVHIFSFQPYAAIDNALLRQTDPADWSVPDNANSVYYSFNHREEVTVHELTQFILANNIHTLLVPEICWKPNWDRLLALQVSKLKICSIPLIEIVIRDEIELHNRLTTTLYCTHWAARVMNEAGVNNGVFLGHGFGRPLARDRVKEKLHRLATRPKIRFLHVAGHNPNTRKNTPQVIEAFAKALALRDDIELTVTSMDPVSTYYSERLPVDITILDRASSRNAILDLYEQHDVSIQVSSHEGLGLGFYESLSRGTPIISLDAPPHNEVVLDGETGWLIPAHPMPMPDNEGAVVPAWRFDTAALTDQIIALKRDAIDQMIVSAELVFRAHFDEVALLTRLLQALPREHKAATAQIKPIPERRRKKWARARRGLKRLIKQALDKTVQWANHLARSVASGIARRLHTLTKLATVDVRRARSRFSEPQAKMRKELLDHFQSSRAALANIRREVRFIKSRIASYAGPNAVLTYLRDESPIFVNTGDLGCPSPIVNGGVWEPENLDVLYSFVTSDTVFLDVGANVGYFSIAIGNRVGRGGQVFAIEPHPVLTNLLERSVQLNGLEAVVRIRQCAVSDQDGTLALFYPDDHLGKGSVTRNTGEQGRHLSVQARRLDDLLPQDLAVDLVKIDVEGHELSALRGMREVLRRSPNVKILFEKLASATVEVDALGEFLDEVGLTLYGVGPHSVLVPLDTAGYGNWIGDILAAPIDAVDQLSRTSFSVYPGQLGGEGRMVGVRTRYLAEHDKPVFWGPDWYLREGIWRVRLHGKFRGSVRLVILEENESVLAEIYLSNTDPEGRFVVSHDIVHFEMRAYAEAGAAIELERVVFQRA